MASPLLSKTPGERHLLLGNEAIVRGALEAGIGFVTCYPGTPSSEVPDTFFRLAPEANYYFEYSVNEKVALEVGGGATLAGVPTLVTMKHVGLNVAADPFMTLAYIGTPGGLVLLSADDPGCHSSQNEQDNRIYARIAGVVCMEPSTAQEAKDMTRDALTLSRQWQRPVLLRTTTRVNHLRGAVVFGGLPDKPARTQEGFVKNPKRFVPVPANSTRMHKELLEFMGEARAEAEKSPWNIVSGPETAKVGFIASGIARAYLHDALEESPDAQVKVLELGFTHPLPEKLIADFLRGLDRVVVLEELEPILEKSVRALAQRLSINVEIIGKENGLLPRYGEYSTSLARKMLAQALGGRFEPLPFCRPEDLVSEPLPVRPPNLCAGCPHRATYSAARHVFGDDAVYSSDIGCYTLGLLPPLRAADFLLCMGSSVSAGTGVSKASGQTVVGFIGDSTFFHSGVTGIINAVYNRHNLLLVVLDNRTTAMTGHQPNPGVDMTIHGPNPSIVSIEAIVKGCCVETVRTVNPLNRKATLAALEELKGMDGVRVLIAKEPCPLHARRMKTAAPTRVAYISEGCTHRYVCLDTLACPAFSKDREGNVHIDPVLCSGCMLCLQVCEHIKARKRSE